MKLTVGSKASYLVTSVTSGIVFSCRAAGEGFRALGWTFLLFLFLFSFFFFCSILVNVRNRWPRDGGAHTPSGGSDVIYG